MLTSDSLWTLISKYQEAAFASSSRLDPKTIALMKVDAAITFHYFNALAKSLEAGMDLDQIKTKIKSFLITVGMRLKKQSCLYTHTIFTHQSALCENSRSHRGSRRTHLPSVNVRCEKSGQSFLFIQI